MTTEGFCPECDAYGEFEQLGDYQHKCQECFETVDARDIPHATVPKGDWCGEGSCPKCQGHSYGPYEEPQEQIVSAGTAKELKTLQSDSRGRVNLGMDYADKEVRVAILNGSE